jgi:7-cyano-7-deazaguanine reductase
VSIDPPNADASPLGKATDYPERYDPALLFAMPRAHAREALGMGGAAPFRGADLWTAYELTWLDARGKPQLALLKFSVPADSPRLAESKSIKLYLGSFAQEKLAGSQELAARIESDLSGACGASVAVAISPFANAAGRIDALPGESLDELGIDTNVYEPEPSFLVAAGPEHDETLRTSLFRSRCPVTSQPDYADVMIRYRGPRIDRSGLLRYLVSYRRHPAFHESCVERIFIDVLRRCRARDLTVYARFLRRGGIEINPFRSNFEPVPDEPSRTLRQ